jgi:hypothetical protein
MEANKRMFEQKQQIREDHHAACYEEMRPFFKKYNLNSILLNLQIDIVIYRNFEQEPLYLEIKVPGGNTYVEETQIDILNEVKDGKWENSYMKRGYYRYLIYIPTVVFVNETDAQKKKIQGYHGIHGIFFENNIRFLVIEPDIVKSKLLIPGDHFHKAVLSRSKKVWRQLLEELDEDGNFGDAESLVKWLNLFFF